MVSLGKKAFSSFLAIGLLASGLFAQDFTGSVQQDPNAGYATYTIDFDGPPRGVSGLFLGNQLLPLPLPIPGGPLFVDPRGLMFLPPIPLNPQGKGKLQVKVQDTALLGLTMEIQAWFLDLKANFVIPNKFLALASGKAIKAPVPKKPSYAMAYDSKGGDTHIQVWGEPGAKATITLKDPKGKVIGTTTVTVGPKGKSKVGAAKLSKAITAGSRWEIQYQNKPTAKPSTIAGGRF